MFKYFLQNNLVEKVEKIDFETLTKLMPKLQGVFGRSIAQQFIELLSNTILDQSEGTDWTNTRICLIDGKKSVHVVSGTGIHDWVLYTEDGIVDIVKSVRKKYLNEFEHVKVVTKRVLGRLLIKYVGNEGADVDARKVGLRKLFQATIDYIQTHSIPSIWENATITVYDSEDNTFKIESGNGKNKFMVTEKKGEPRIVYTVNNQMKELKETENEHTTKDEGIFSRIVGIFSHLK